LLGRRARWHDSPTAALAACAGKAVIFSNELVDAFPVRRFQKSGKIWQELAVAFEADGCVRESLLPPATLPPSSGFAPQHPPGQWIEVHDSYRRWLTDWLPHWQAGRMLTIDYGACADSLYHRRPLGTVRAYLLQQRFVGPEIYQNVGRQDLSADVNFTDLMNWSQPWCAGQHLQSLGDFLRDAIDPRQPADRALGDASGAGAAFLVLDEQCAGR
jgi:SAM-dependent MidA family methyltransferase